MFSLEFLDDLRVAELELVINDFKRGSKIIEFGAGTGTQALSLSKRGFDVRAIDLPQSDFSEARVFPIIDYNGRQLPLSDGSFDVVYSSNVLEHVVDISCTFDEFRRVLKPTGHGIHLMPSVAWRAWTFASGIPTGFVAAASMVRLLWRPVDGEMRGKSLTRLAKTFAAALLPLGHGTSPEGISELWTFSARSWRKRFERGGFEVIACRPSGLFHTGHMLLGPRLSIHARKSLSKWIGSAATVYITRPIEPNGRAR
jgi:SAM-dependent methyltransferase